MSIAEFVRDARVSTGKTGDDSPLVEWLTTQEVETAEDFIQLTEQSLAAIAQRAPVSLVPCSPARSMPFRHCCSDSLSACLCHWLPFICHSIAHVADALACLSLGASAFVTRCLCLSDRRTAGADGCIKEGPRRSHQLALFTSRRR